MKNSATSFVPNARIGILMILATTLCFACLDVLAQYLTRRYPTPQVVWFRYVFHVFFLLMFVQTSGGTTASKNLLKVGNLRWALIRGGILFSTTCINFVALKFLPVTENTAINFICPLIVSVMAVFILNERMSGLRWCAVLLGFVGVLIIMRPGMNNGFGWAVLLPLCLAFLYAAFQVYTRKYAHHDNPLSLLFFSGLVGAVLVSFVAPFFWQTLSWADIAWLMLLGLLGCLGHGFMIRAFAHAPATVLAPFLYVQIIFVTTLAWLLLGQIPDRISLIGMGVIVMAGLIAALLQVKEKRQEDRMANAEIISPTPE